MLRKLRLKFVAINMAIVTAMLCVIFGLVYQFTRNNLETESVNMMQSIAAAPFQLVIPGEAPGELRLPYFASDSDSLFQLSGLPLYAYVSSLLRAQSPPDICAAARAADLSE